MNDRTKAIMMVVGLSHQLREWIDFSKSLGYVTQRFKHESGILSNQCGKLISMLEADDEEVYEHSIQISSLFEKIAKMDSQDMKRIYGLISKIEEQNKEHV